MPRSTLQGFVSDFKSAWKSAIAPLIILLIVILSVRMWQGLQKEPVIFVSPGVRLQVVNPEGEPVAGCHVEQEWGDSSYRHAEFTDSAISDSNGRVELPPRSMKISALEKAIGPSIQKLEGMGHANPGGLYSVITITSYENKLCELFLEEDYLGPHAVETQTADGFLGRRVVLQPKDVNDWLEVGNLKKVEEIIRRDGPSALTVTDGLLGHTPLHSAVMRGDIELVQFLFELGADANVRNAYGATPIHYENGIGTRWKEMIELLVEHGADVNAKDDQGRTPLQRAILDRHKAFLRQLGAK